MRKVFSFLVSAVLCLAVLAFIGYQIYAALTKDYATETAVRVSVEESVSASGYIIRDEVVLSGSANGLTEYVVGDGQKVARGETIAYIYSRAEDAGIRSRIEQVDSRISHIEKLQESQGLYKMSLYQLESRIEAMTLEIASLAYSKNCSSMEQMKSDLAGYLYQVQLAKGEVTDLEGELDQLRAEKEALAASLVGDTDCISACEPGYFVSYVDGLETVLTANDATGLTVADLRELEETALAGSGSSDVLGKLVLDYCWYFACILSVQDAEGLSTGSTVSISFPFALDQTLPATVCAVSKAEEGYVAAVFRSERFVPELALLRRQTATIVRGRCSGLKISKAALRVVDGTKGVYVVKGIEAKFVPVNILLEKDTYYVVEETGQSGSLALYDSVIVEGKDIYDGKIIK